MPPTGSGGRSTTTVSDWDEEEQRRQMSLAASLCHLEWHERKINLVDTPGDPGFQADALAALRVVEGALVVVNGVNGVEVQTTRLWERARGARPLPRALREHARPRARGLLRARSSSCSSQLSDRCVAVEIPIGHEHELKGIVDLLHMSAYLDPGGEREAQARRRSRRTSPPQAEEYRDKLVEAVVETDEALMERYLEGEEISGEELARRAQERGRRGSSSSRSPAASATKNLGTTGLLDLLVEGIPSPAKKPIAVDVDGGGPAAFVFKTVADPFAGPHQPLPRALGHALGRLDARQLAHARARSASASC